MRRLTRDIAVQLIIGVCLDVLALLSIRCTDLGTEPVVPAAQWIELENFRYARSGWLDFISIEAYYAPAPGESIDSMKVVNHSDRDTAYIGGDLQGVGGGSVYKKFEFPDGYVDRLPFQLSLSVFIKTH